MSLLNRLFGSKPTPQFNAPIAPDTAFYAIGDLHGCASKLEKILPNLADDIPTIFVGDYVDRGEESADVLRKVMALEQNKNVTCLFGNHEEMMLSFLDNPEEKGSRWLRYGGLQTLASFGVRGVSAGSKGETLEQAANDLHDAMGDDMIAWLRALPTHWITGNVAVVHAAADPHLAMSEQSDKTLRWGHPDFGTVPRVDKIWVLHGHTIVDHPTTTAGRISIDTGAYATGRLTAAHVTTGNVEFIQV